MQSSQKTKSRIDEANPEKENERPSADQTAKKHYELKEV